MKRLFIAIPIQEKTRNEIVKGFFADETVRKLPVRWTAVQNLHLTLQFLGDTEEKRIPALKQIMAQAAGAGVCGDLVFTKVGAFPDPASPRIIWLGIQRNEYLLKMQRELTQKLLESGFTADRKKFKAHLTLGRVRENAELPEGVLHHLEEIRNGILISNSPLDRVTLFESVLRSGGPIYSVVYETKPV